MLIAQITDLHVVTEGAGPIHGVDSNACLRAAVEQLNAMTPRPDVVVVTGDVTDHGRPEEYRVLAAILARLDIPLYPIPGNHDERAAFAEAFAPHEVLPQKAELLTYAVETRPVRLVGLDSTIAGRHDGGVCERRLAWLDEVLAREPDVPTLVFMHHPPFKTGIWWMDSVGLLNPRGLRAVIDRHRQVERVLCGHIHRPIQAHWGRTMLSVSPSTCHQVALDLVPESHPQLIAEPPALQLHTWTGDGFVSHTAYIAYPAAPIDLRPFFGDWERIKGELKEGQGLAKGGAG